MNENNSPAMRIYTSRAGKAQKWWRDQDSVASWDEFVEWLMAPSAGGKEGRPYVPAVFSEPRTRRMNQHIVERYAITLDADKAGADYIERLAKVMPWLAISHTTASHGCDGKGERWRTIIPIGARTPVEAKSIATWLVDRIGRDRFDAQASTSPVAVAYAPAWDGAQYVHHDGPALDVDALLMTEVDEVGWNRGGADGEQPTVDEYLAELAARGECAYGKTALEKVAEKVAASPDGERHKDIYGCAARFVELSLAGCWGSGEANDLAGAAGECADDGEPAFWEAVGSALRRGVEAKTECDDHKPAEVAPEFDETRGVVSGRVADSRLGVKVKQRKLPPPSAPARVARRFLNMFISEDGCVKLRTWKGSLYEWKVTHWESISDETMLVELQTYTEGAYYMKPDGNGGSKETNWSPTDLKKKNLLNGIKHTAGAYILPSVLVNSFFDCVDGTCAVDGANKRWLSFTNGIFDVATDDRMDHSPVFFNTTMRPFDYDLDAPEPEQLLKVLKDFFGHEKGADGGPDGGAASIAAFQEQMGFLVFGRNSDRLKAIVVWQGDRDTGKSVMTDLVDTLLGPGGMVGLHPVTFVDKFGREVLIEAEVGAFTEADFTGVGRASTNLLKAITGFDKVNINKKNKGDFSGKLEARILMVSNHAPKLDDSSGAITNRVEHSCSAFSRVFSKEEQDPELLEKLGEEFTEIAMWALRGYKRALERGHLKASPSGEALAAEIVGMSSPMSAWMDSRVVSDRSGRLPTGVAAADYEAWCEENGLERAPRYMDATAFGKAVRRVRPSMVSSTFKVDGKSVNGYRGYRLA